MNLFSQLLNTTRSLLFKIEHKTFPYTTYSSSSLYIPLSQWSFSNNCLHYFFHFLLPSLQSPTKNSWTDAIPRLLLISPSKELLQRSSMTSMLLSPWTHSSSLFLPLFHLRFLTSWSSFWRTRSPEPGSRPPLQAHLLYQASASPLALLLRPVSS